MNNITRLLKLSGLVALITSCGGGSSAPSSISAPDPDSTADPAGLLVPVATDAALLNVIRNGFVDDTSNNIERMASESLSADASASDSASTNFTTTYNLEANIDEHDAVKYNGNHLFIAPSRSMDCCFIFEDIACAHNGKPIIRLNFSKTDQFGTGKVLPISKELLNLLEKWREIVGSEGYILRSINKHGHIGNSLHPASISTILKTLQEGLKSGTNQQPLSGHSFRVGAALDLLEQGETLEKIMLRGGWQTDSTAMKYLRRWIY